jgi:hypothetical protein
MSVNSPIFKISAYYFCKNLSMQCSDRSGWFRPAYPPNTSRQSRSRCWRRDLQRCAYGSYPIARGRFRRRAVLLLWALVPFGNCLKTGPLRRAKLYFAGHTLVFGDFEEVEEPGSVHGVPNESFQLGRGVAIGISRHALTGRIRV